MSILKIAAFGDSLTEGVALKDGQKNWTDLISEELSADVKNCGVGGNTTGAGLVRMENDVISYNPDIVLIAFGMNDHVIVDRNGRTKTEREKFALNLCEMVTRVRKIDAAPVLITPNAVIEEYYFKRHPKEWYAEVGGANAQIESFCRMIRKTAKELSLPLVDIYEESKNCDLTRILRTPEHGGLADGVHPYGRGISFYAEHILSALRGMISTNGR